MLLLNLRTAWISVPSFWHNAPIFTWGVWWLCPTACTGCSVRFRYLVPVMKLYNQAWKSYWIEHIEISYWHWIQSPAVEVHSTRIVVASHIVSNFVLLSLSVYVFNSYYNPHNKRRLSAIWCPHFNENDMVIACNMYSVLWSLVTWETRSGCEQNLIKMSVLWLPSCHQNVWTHRPLP